MNANGQDEIFDMVKPCDPYRISLQDLLNRYFPSTYIRTHIPCHCLRVTHKYVRTCSYLLCLCKFIIHTHTHFLFSGQGETVISILIDLNGFWTYENREVLLAEAQDISTN